MSNNTTKPSNPDSLLDDIDFSLAWTPSVSDSSSYFSQQIDSITSWSQNLEALLTPDESFLNSLPGWSSANTTNQVINPISRFPDESSAFPTLIMDDSEDFWANISDIKLENTQKTNVNVKDNSKDFIAWIGLKFPEIKEIFQFLNEDKELSDFLKNKISSFFCWKNYEKPLSWDYSYEWDEWFVWRDTPIENINRIWLILMYCMYEFWIAIDCKWGPEYAIKYITHNFITDKSYLEKFSHIMVSKNRRYFWSTENPKVYVQFNPETRSRMNLLFNFLLNYAKSQKKAIEKLIEDDARAKRFAEKMERVRQRQEWLTVNNDLLKRMEEDEKAMEKKYGKLDK